MRIILSDLHLPCTIPDKNQLSRKKNREKAESSSFFPNSLPTFAIQKGNN